MYTFIHCSARRIDSKLRATAAELIRSSARSSSPPRLVVVASDIGAERIGSASWIFGERTTTSKLTSCRASPHTSSATRGLLSPMAQLLLRWPPRLPAQRLQPAQPQGGCYPRLLPLSTQDIRDQFSGGFDYYSRKAALLQRTHLLLRWLLAA
jgi:hypothetical protein